MGFGDFSWEREEWAPREEEGPGDLDLSLGDAALGRIGDRDRPSALEELRKRDWVSWGVGGREGLVGVQEIISGVGGIWCCKCNNSSFAFKQNYNDTNF